MPDNRRIHIRARFFGRCVEGWIDGRKILSRWIPPDHPRARDGRIALWTFEIWSEFDNVRT